MKLEPIIQSEVSQKEKHQYSILMHIYTIASLSIHLLMDIWVAIVNSGAVSNGIHVSFSIFISSGYMPRSGIGSYGGFIPSF